MSTIELPDGRTVDVPAAAGHHDNDIKLYDIVTRLIVLPVGTTIHVPAEHEWTILAMAAIPHGQYSPPGCEKRDPYLWGDVQINLGERGVVERTNALVLMDRYWSRFNLCPELVDAVAKLEQTQHALQIAPSIPELAHTVERALDAIRLYVAAASPASPATRLPESFTVEQVACEASRPPKYRELDVELTVFIKRAVGTVKAPWKL